MKTVYTLVLVIALQVIAMSQTQDNTGKQAKSILVSTTKRNSLKMENKSEEELTATKKELWIQRITELNKQIETLESLKEEVNKEINQFFVLNPKEASSIKAITEMIPDATRVLPADQVNADLFRKIEESVAAYRIFKEKYDQNKESINSFLITLQDKPYLSAKVNYLISQASYAKEMAEELREESEQLTDYSARLGNLGNAEEHEFIALSKQEEALSCFNTSSLASCKNKF